MKKVCIFIMYFVFTMSLSAISFESNRLKKDYFENLTVADYINSEEFVKNLAKFEPNIKPDEIVKHLVKTNYLEDINTNVYNSKLSNNFELHIIENINNKNFQVIFQIDFENGFSLFDKNGNKISEIKLLDGLVLESFGEEEAEAATPTLRCIRATVAYMRNACVANDGCAVLCDLMSTACTNQMYIVAAAHCAANNNQPPK